MIEEDLIVSAIAKLAQCCERKVGKLNLRIVAKWFIIKHIHNRRAMQATKALAIAVTNLTISERVSGPGINVSREGSFCLISNCLIKRNVKPFTRQVLCNGL